MKNRQQESLKPLFTPQTFSNSPLIITCSSDIGVRRNGGRNGSRYAPSAILSALAKLNNHLPYGHIAAIECTDQQAERLDFERAQRDQIAIIKNLLDPSLPRLIQLGGGHDHIYPLLMALESSYERILILNFDAHLDTRQDDKAHSGTPFRNYDRDGSTSCELIQIGIHDYANSVTTQSPLQRIQQQIIPKTAKTDGQLLQEISLVFSKQQLSAQTLIVLSLDCDGLAAAEMEAVSAVNHNGFGSQLIRHAIKLIKETPAATAMGIYEYNPIYDNLNQKGSRLLAALIYDYLKAE